MSEKFFKTYEQQLDILEARGITMSPKHVRKKAKNLLQREGYYKLINGYKKLFIDTSQQNEHFKSGTSIEEIHALYIFDRSLRELCLRYILHVETNIKTLIAYTISSHYGHENYLLYKNFNTSKQNANKDIASVIADLNANIAKNSTDPCIQHYLQCYGYVPIWVLNSVLTLGNISRLYSIMTISDRQEISKIFKISDNTLESFLHMLSIVRNFSAHGNRLYCFRTKRALANTPMHANLQIAQVNNDYICGKRDLFASFIALRYLLSANDYTKAFKELNGLINNLSRKLTVINIDDILLEMGFPSNWKNIINRGIKR